MGNSHDNKESAEIDDLNPSNPRIISRALDLETIRTPTLEAIDSPKSIRHRLAFI